MPLNQSKVINVSAITPDTPLLLKHAARFAFPDGSMTVSGLRREAERNRLVIERIANRDYTTLSAITQMREQCRVQVKEHASGLDRSDEGKIYERSSWIIRDGDKFVATGCTPDEAGEAERRLSEYIAQKYRPERTERDIEQIDIADVLAVYDEDVRPRQVNKRKLDERMVRLTKWWGGKMLSSVSPKVCLAYRDHVGSDGAARRDLEDLRAAINYHAKQGLHRGMIYVTLPNKGLPRDRWLTRDEAAKLIWVCWRHGRTIRLPRGKNKGQIVESKWHDLRHIARFVLIALYTGTRAGAVAAASPHKAEGRSWVDLENGIFYRLAIGKRETNKRQPPVPIPPHLLAHMRRWERLGIAKDFFVEWRGNPIQSIKTGWKTAITLAGLEGQVSPHTLRHTAATWLMQLGTDKWEAAGYLGMSVEMLDRVYGHHHPDHLKGAANAFKGRIDLKPRNAGPRVSVRA